MGFLLYLVVIIGGPLIVISTLNLQLIVFMCGIIMLTRSMVSLLSNQSNGQNTFLHPLQMASMAIIGFFAIQKHLTKTTLWKGRRV
jgi:chlorobactene glucosyltransferase